MQGFARRSNKFGIAVAVRSSSSAFQKMVHDSPAIAFKEDRGLLSWVIPPPLLFGFGGLQVD